MLPWQMDNSEIKILDGCDAQIVDKNENEYIVEFNDENMEIIEGTISKSEFQNHPIKAHIGYWFSLITYIYKNKTYTKTWPVPRFWNKKLKE